MFVEIAIIMCKAKLMTLNWFFYYHTNLHVDTFSSPSSPRLFELTNSTTSSSFSNDSEAESGSSNSEYEDGPDTDNELEI